MNSNRIIICVGILILALFSSGLGIAQTAEDSTEVKRIWDRPDKHYLSFRLDYAVRDLSNGHAFSYEGEYLGTNASNYEWISYDSTLIDLSNIEKYYNFKFDLLISTIKPLSIGLTYNLNAYRARIDYDSYTSIRFIPFLGLGAVIDYRYNIKKVKGLFLNPTATIGYYISDEEFSGKGKENYYNLKLAAGYALLDKIDLRLYTDFTRWRYNEKFGSEIYPDRDKVIKSHINHMNFGLGLAYRFHLIPD